MTTVLTVLLYPVVYLLVVLTNFDPTPKRPR
jgi:hypothetical protein